MPTARENELFRKSENVKKWISYYRRNWDLFAEEVLGIKLYPVQKLKLHMIGVADEYWDFSSRSTAKSFIVGVAAFCAMSLYPHSEVVVTSSSIPQSARLVRDKMIKEIIKKYSPYLKHLYEKGYLTVKMLDEGVFVLTNTLNESTTTVAVCSENARGMRSTFTIYEETRLLKKSILDSVFEPMGHERPAPFTLDTKYKTDRWIKAAKSCYISSTRYEWEWFIREYRKCVEGYYTSKHEKYIPMAEDIYTAIQEGSRTWADYRKAKKKMSLSDFRMEIENETQGSPEGAFFSLKNFKDNQEIANAYVPPTDTQVLADTKPPFREKQSDEIRLVGVDYAFANTTFKTGYGNDNTIIECWSAVWKNGRFIRSLEYMEQWPASDSTGAQWRVRELFWDYNADFIVNDLRAGGETLYNLMTERKTHPKRGYMWDSRGLTVAQNLNYHLVTESKLSDLRMRTVDKDAVPCIIPAQGSAQKNGVWWLALRKHLECNDIKMLVSMADKQQEMEDSGEYFKLTSEELADKLAPYGETDLLIQEAIKLNTEIKGDNLYLKEDNKATKDRVVVMSYVNIVIDKIEMEWNKRLTNDDEDYDIDDLQLVY